MKQKTIKLFTPKFNPPFMRFFIKASPEMQEIIRSVNRELKITIDKIEIKINTEFKRKGKTLKTFK